MDLAISSGFFFVISISICIGSFTSFVFKYLALSFPSEGKLANRVGHLKCLWRCAFMFFEAHIKSSNDGSDDFPSTHQLYTLYIKHLLIIQILILTVIYYFLVRTHRLCYIIDLLCCTAGSAAIYIIF